MANTKDGAVLTDRHRRTQVRLAVAADSDIRRAWQVLELGDIDGTRAQWLGRMIDIVRRYYKVSQSEAEVYLRRYRLAEIGTSSGVVEAPPADLRVAAGVLDAAGPQALKRQIGRGATESQAYLRIRGTFAAETHKMILAGGRSLLRTTGAADPRAIGYRRVAAPGCCTFCGMLASRGPAYTSEAAALAKGNSNPYHAGCHCTVEIIYGDWKPTKQEQEWVDTYRDAAQAAQNAGQARTAGNILHRMRTDGGFRDSPAVRNVQADN
jgi:hypothetical protein